MRGPGLVWSVSTIIVSLLVFTTVGCNGNRATPTAAVEAFFEATENKDCERLVGLIDYSDQEQGIAIDKEKQVQDCKERYRQAQDDQYGDIDYKIIGEKVDGDRAEVEYEITMKKGEKQTQTAFLKKDQEGWKISYFGSSGTIGGPPRQTWPSR